ncbi:MAG: hypothetical protein ACI8X3_001804 [Saprospiraceae bacterium]|jgi:hypothetical protein
MTINEAYNFFKSLRTETDKKSEIKIYGNFIGILSDLENRDFTEEERQSIEKKLDHLVLKVNPKNRRKYFKNTLNKFKIYLHDKFSLISEGYYTALGMSLGMCFGTTFGVFFGIGFFDGPEQSYGSGMGLSLGMFIGLLIGHYMDNQVIEQGRVLKTKI